MTDKNKVVETTKKVSKPAAKKNSTKPVAKKVAAKKTVKKVKVSKAVKTKANFVENSIEQLQELLQDNLGGLNKDKAEVFAKNIWLAGLGAYSRTFNEVTDRVEGLQDRYENINTEGHKVFDELVDRGSSVQGDLEKTVKERRDSLDGRVDDFKKRFGVGFSSFVDIPARLRDAAEKLEKLSDRLQKK